MYVYVLIVTGKNLRKVNKVGLVSNVSFFFPMEMNIYTTDIKTTVTWHHDYYGCQGYKKSNN